MFKYTCNTCNREEHRHVTGWSIECECGGVLRSKISSICSYCGEFHYKPTKQCRCGNTMLTHYYDDEPAVNDSLIKEIIDCIGNNVTTAFECKCGKRHAIYRTTQTNAFCVCCGEFMEQSLTSLKAYRKKRGWSQRLMAAEIGISPKTYIGIENNTASPSAKTRAKCVKLLA